MADQLNLELESVFQIDHHEKGLREPSGLAMSSDGTLWLVGDRKRFLFRIDQTGNILQRLRVGNRGLEGIAIGPSGNLWAVDENSAKILQYDSSNGDELSDYRLEELEGFELIAEGFKRHANKGLEGIAFDPQRDEWLLLKEDHPALLIAVNSGFTRIESVDDLNEEVGFQHESESVDLSGICHDPSRDLFWIVSHEAARVFGYSRKTRRVTLRFDLDSDNGKRVRQAEGVAIDPSGKRLFVVGDRDEKLFVYQLTEVHSLHRRTHLQ